MDRYASLVSFLFSSLLWGKDDDHSSLDSSSFEIFIRKFESLSILSLSLLIDQFEGGLTKIVFC